MLKTLYGKLALVLVLLLVTIGIGYALFSLYASQLFLQEVNQRFNRDLARQLLVQQRPSGGEWLQEAEIRQIFSDYMQINPAIEIYLLDASGKILAFEAPQMKIKRDRVGLGPVRRFLAGDMSYPILGDDPRSETRQKIFSAAAFPLQGPARQYLYVVLGGEEYETAQRLLHGSYFLQLSTLAVGASVAFGLLLGLFIFSQLTRRLFRLAHHIEQFRRSGFRRHSPYRGSRLKLLHDEIDILGETYNAMAERIIEQMQALESKDTLRRNLIANVSHDLRTPLASLQGYLETLQLKTGELNVEQRKHYLAIAHQQSQRLTRLVTELFELSKLDAHETAPKLEMVALGELVMDVVQKYRLQAEEQRIKLELRIPTGLPFVRADIAMLDRVLENLLGNALTHTPEEGTICIALQRQGGGVRLSLCNSGKGIGEAELAHVFERFYQAPEKRHGRGAGLGLAIVKRILELHGSEIEAESTPGELTCFRFVLPVKQED
ncbi:MAG TPA: HAMP domain-containing sensor histidine kinase [Gammaproteobacteria bacterium]